MIDYSSVVLSPVITEKAVSLGAGCNRYAIYVSVSATKFKVRKAVKALFGLDAVSICSLNLRGKRKRCRGVYGRRKNRKKVYFSLPEGQEFNVVGVK